MPLTPKGTILTYKALLQPITYGVVEFVMAIRAKNLEIRLKPILTVKIYMVAFKDLGKFVVATYRTVRQFSSGHNNRGAQFVFVVDVPKPNSTLATTEGLIAPVRYFKDGDAAIATNNSLRRLLHSYKLAFTAAAMLFRTARHSLEWFTAYLAILGKPSKNLALTPSDASQGIRCKFQFVPPPSLHTCIIAQGGRSRQCL